MGLIAFSRLAVSKRNALDDPNQLAPNLNAYINGSPLFTGDAGSGESNIRQ